MSDPRVEAIRANPLVGRGSCSRIDECMSDDEVLEHVKDLDVDKAVVWALDDEELWLEQGLNQRWGEDDDPQLLTYNDFIARRKEAEGEDDRRGP
jgi:hypothetical protein